MAAAAVGRGGAHLGASHLSQPGDVSNNQGRIAQRLCVNDSCAGLHCRLDSSKVGDGHKGGGDAALGGQEVLQQMAGGVRSIWRYKSPGHCILAAVLNVAA